MLVTAAILAGCDRCSKAKEPGSAKLQPSSTLDLTIPDDLKIEEIKAGDGAVAADGKLASVLYEGTLPNGSVFDSAQDRAEPFQFVVGAGMTIAGWDLGMRGLKVGGIRKVTIPPRLAYGPRAFGEKIPPGSTLTFKIELLKVE